MARQNRTTVAAKATARDILPYAATALAGAILVAVAATTADAQQKGSDASYLVVDGLDTCGALVDDGTGAEDILIDDGWFIEDVYQNGPFITEISASKIFDDGSDAYVFALIETYPSAQIGYCSFDVQAVGGTVDLGIVEETYDTVGTVEPGEFGVHGSWEAASDDAIYLVLANYEDESDYLFVQMTKVGDSSQQSGGK